MTLILTFQTPHCVVIASDRHVSYRGRVHQHPATKLVLYYSDLAFAFTGRASMLDESGAWINTGRWLVDALLRAGDRNHDRVFRAVKERADECYQKRRSRGEPLLPLAIAGFGWEPPKLPKPANHIQGVVSNFHQNPKSPRMDFACDVQSLDVSGGVFNCSCFGCGLNPTESTWLAKELRSAADNERPCEVYMHLLKQSIRQVAARCNEIEVGREVLAAILPRDAAGKNPVVVRSAYGECGFYAASSDMAPGIGVQRPLNECCQFCRFPKRRDDGIFESPHLIHAGLDTFGQWSRGLRTKWIAH